MEPAPIPPPTGDVAPYIPPKIDIRAIAQTQRELLQRYLAYFLLNMLVVGLSVALLQPGQLPAGALVWTILGMRLVALVFAILAVISTYKLAGALHAGGPAVYAFCMVIPCVNLFILLSLNGKATSTLRCAGLSVGLMGPDMSELDAKGF